MANHKRHFIRDLSVLFVLSVLVSGGFGFLLPKVMDVFALAPPNIVNYQGRILNSNGAPVSDASLSMEFRLYDAAAAGTCLWSNSSSDCDTDTPASTVARTVTLTDGLFSENLGDTTLGAPYAAIPDTVFGDNASLYLEIEIAGEVLSPRKRVVSSGFALNSGTLDGMDSADFLAAAGDSASGEFDFTSAEFLGASPFVFEGTTNDGTNLTTFTVTDPTAPRTITFKDESGTVAYLSDIGGSSNLDDAYNNYGATASIINIDGAEGQTGGLEWSVDGTGDFTVDLQSTGDFVVQNAGADWFTLNDLQQVVVASTLDGAIFDIDATAVTADNIFDIDANALTSGSIFNPRTTAAFTGDLFQLISSGASTGNLFRGVITNASSTATGLYIDNDGTGESIFLDPDGDTGGTNSDTAGGALHITNTGNASQAFTVYSNHGASANAALVELIAANSLFDRQVLRVQNASDEPSIEIVQSGDTTTNSASLLISSSGDGSAIHALTTGGASVSEPLATLNAQNSLNTQDVLVIENEGTGRGLYIDQNGDYDALAIDSSTTYRTLLNLTGGAVTTGDFIVMTAPLLTSGTLINGYTGAATFSGNLLQLASNGAASGNFVSLQSTAAATGNFIDISSTNATATATPINIDLNNGDNVNNVFVLTTDETTESGTSAGTVKALITSDGEFFSDVGFSAGATTNYYDGQITDNDANADNYFDVNLAAGADSFRILTGNLFVGNGSPDSTLNGEDFYVEGGAEFDGPLRFDGNLTANGTTTFNDDVDFTFVTDGADSENVLITSTHATDVNLSPLHIQFTDTAATSTGFNYVAFLRNLDDGGSTGIPDGGLAITNEDTNEVMADGIIITSAAGGITNGLNLTDADITNALDVDANFILHDGIRVFEGSTGTLTWEDTSGNDLMTLTDGGTTGTLAVTGDITCTDCFDFAEFEDTLDLDASTEVNLGANTYTMDLDGAGDFIFTDAGSAFFTLNDDRTAVYQDTVNTTGDVFSLFSTSVTSGTVLDLLSSNSAFTGTVQTITIPSASASGDGLFVLNSGTGSSVFVDANGDTGGTINDASGGAVHITNTGNADQGLTVYSNHSAPTSPLAEFIMESSAAGEHVTSIRNDGTGSAIFIDQNGDTGSTINDTTGGAVHISNTGNTGAGLSVYTNEPASVAPLVYIHADTNGFDNPALYVQLDTNDLNVPAVQIDHNYTDSTLNTAAALDIDANTSAHVLNLYNDGGTASNDGIWIQACQDSNPNAGCNMITFADGDGDIIGAVEGDGAGGVTNASAGSDYAELFPGTYANFSVGDVLALDSSGNIKLAGDEHEMIGTFSVAPNTLGNWVNDWQAAGTYVPVALLGQVPVNVTDENGSISVGDYLTLSSTSGVAMKQTGPGYTIGVALENHASGSGQIEVYITPGWHAGGVIAHDGTNNTFTQDFLFEESSTADAGTQGKASRALTFRGSGWNGASADDIDMTLFTDVNSSSDYQLSITNDTGTEVAFVNQDGDLAIAGRLYPSDRGILQTDKYIYYDSTGSPTLDYMRTNAAGWGVGSYDFAEMFPSEDTVVAGEIVVFADGLESVKRSTGVEYDQRIAGIVSTRPGFLAGEFIDGHVPIALAGRVPTFVTAENGAIKPGDPLTTSSIAGYAMKATEPGPIVGYAMEPLTKGTGSIVVYVNVSYYDGGPVTDAPAANNTASGMVNLSSLTLSGNLALGGGTISSVAAISGIGHVWSIEADGDFVTRGRITNIVESYGGEDVETYGVTSRETTIQLSGTIQLQNGTAVVDFNEVDPKFVNIISNTQPYRVFLTANGATGALYAASREQSGFVIKESNGSSNVVVDWMVVGYHKDYEPVDAVTETTTVEEPEAPESVEPINDESEEVEKPIFDEPADDPASEEEVIEEASSEDAPPTEEVVQEEVTPGDESVPEEAPVDDAPTE